MKHTIKELDAGQLDLMWNFLMLGKQKSNIPALKECCDQLRQLMIQKTAGQRRGDPNNYIGFEDLGTIVNSIVKHHHTDLYIEEPEAHIYPSTQKSFVYSLAEMLNGEKKHSCFISTHSPYILTAFNNLILAGEKIKSARNKVQQIISEEQTLSYDDVAAFEMKDGKAICIMDADFRLISADAIDNASIEIGNDFDYLLNL